MPNFKKGGIISISTNDPLLSQTTKSFRITTDDRYDKWKDPIVKTDEDLKHLRKIRGTRADFILNDDPIIENQCLGTAKKTGKRCERIIPLDYCWQHVYQRGVE